MMTDQAGMLPSLLQSAFGLSAPLRTQQPKPPAPPEAPPPAPLPPIPKFEPIPVPPVPVIDPTDLAENAETEISSGAELQPPSDGQAPAGENAPQSDSLPAEAESKIARTGALTREEILGRSSSGRLYDIYTLEDKIPVLEDGEEPIVVRPSAEEDEPPQKKKRKKKKKLHIGLKLLIIFLVLVIAASGTYVAYGRWGTGLVSDYALKKTQELYGKKSAGTVPNNIREEFVALYASNPDIKGWITLPGAELNLPVMQSQRGEGFYETNNFYKLSDGYGLPYFVKDIPLAQPVNNMVLKARWFADGRVASKLADYKDLDFFNQNTAFALDTVYKENRWAVIAVFYANTRQELGEVFAYTQTEFDTDFEAAYFIKEAQKRSLIKTSVKTRVDDSFLSISLQTPDIDGADLVICARQLREGEPDPAAGEMNPNPLMPDQWYLREGQVKPEDDALWQGTLADADAIKEAMAKAIETHRFGTGVSFVLELDGEVGATTTLPDTSASTSGTSTGTTSGGSTSHTTTTRSTTTTRPGATPPPKPFAGTLKVTVNGVVKEGPTQSIIAGVIEAEMGSGFKKEALKAQAVAAYTYIKHSQAAGNPAPSVVFKEPGSLATQAAGEVLGQMMTKGGQPICSTFYAISAGKTAYSRDVWGGDLPYLVSVDSSVDQNVTGFLSTRVYSERQVADCVRKELGIDLYNIADRKKWIVVTQRDDHGLYAKKVSIGNGASEQKGTWVRDTLFKSASVGASNTLRSHCYTISYEGGNFVFTVKGYGHGVGMSQTGANAYAAQGRDYRWILSHYYSFDSAGITLA